MSDMGEIGKIMKSLSRERRANNRESSPKLLEAAGIRFVSKNVGAHLIVTANDGTRVDFWPGTGLWRVAGETKKHRGVHPLIARCAKTEGKPGCAIGKSQAQ
jgi:hypothetical protein